MTAIVTSFGPEGYLVYARRFLDTFAEHWPVDVGLVAYVEEPTDHPRAEMRDLRRVDDCAAFLMRHGATDWARGRGVMPVWREKERVAGYSFRTDAVKFCRKPFAIRDAARRMERGILAWIDADVVTTAPVEARFVETLLSGFDVAYLGRRDTHSECGFVAFRLPEALSLIETWTGYYAGDACFGFREWHDSYLFDRARARLPGVRCRDLTPGGHGHCWTRSPLAAVMDHCKGPRKLLGRSPEMMT